MADRTEAGEPNRTRFSDQAARNTLAPNPLRRTLSSVCAVKAT